MEEKEIGYLEDDILSEYHAPVYWGVKVDKISGKDFSIGACISYESWNNELYLFLNLGKWTISIGRLSKI